MIVPSAPSTDICPQIRKKKYLSKTLSSMASASRSPTPRIQNENTALLPIPVSANVNNALPIP